MGKKADRQAAARIMWAAERMISDTAGLLRHEDRERVFDVAKQVRNLAGDTFWDRLYDDED